MSKLERATHICLIAVCVVSIALLLERRFTPAPVARAGTAAELLGKRLDAPGIDWKKAHLNAVLFISTSCHFCRESIPFYQRLAEERRKRSAQVALSALSREPGEKVKAYLSAERVFVDGAYQLSAAHSRLRGTPTLLLIDSNGVVQRSYVGKLDSAQEEEVLKLVRHATI
jgi:thiol-disulfide isomerase/thioredoxin